jgi:hypothetical protein
MAAEPNWRPRPGKENRGLGAAPYMAMIKPSAHSTAKPTIQEAHTSFPVTGRK